MHQRDGTSGANPKYGGFRLLVGERWPGEIDVRTEESDRKSGGVFWLSLLLTALLVAFTAYGMVTSDQQTLDKVFEVVRYGVIAVVSWAFGKVTR